MVSKTDTDSVNIRVLVSMPEPMLLRGLLECINSIDDVEVVGTASTGREALDLATRKFPSVMVLSSRISEPGFEDVCRELRTIEPRCYPLLITVEEHRGVILDAARAGARGLLNMSATADNIRATLRQIHCGNVDFDDSALAAILDDYSRSHQERPAPPASPAPANRTASTHATDAIARLSKRERQVLALVAAGLTSREIATDLCISIRTVEAHRARVSDKLGIRTVAGLTRYALKMGMTSVIR